ncbi:MAG: Niacin transporter NiaX [Oscillospiraceae bacterium]|jgi:niacin transporter
MERKNGMQSIQTMTIAALLCAVGIVIPMTFPKIWVGAASFTLASHVPIFLAMFISPAVAVTVALGTTLGFFLSGLPLVITLRALSHVIFVTIGAMFLKKHPMVMAFSAGNLLFGMVLGMIHALSEVIVVTYFFFGGQLSSATYSSGYVTSVLLLVGLGGFIHSMVDFGLSIAAWKPISRVIRIPVNAKAKG